jgi:dihydroorotate dehydrogenase
MRLMHCLDPETAHGLALKALAAGLGLKSGPVTSPRLATTLAGLALPNPVGIAAGFDKNAEVVRAALAAGPGFLEVGAVTPRPQPGNPRPRLFRLAEDQAAINRFGFNNQGMEAVSNRLAAARGAGIVGVNLGANKDAADRAQDYVTVLRRLYALADFFTVNVSSPNTEKLRDLQGRAALDALLGRVMAAKAELGGEKPVFLKIAPDLTQAEIADIAELALAHGLDGIIATNTTLARDGLASRHGTQAGGGAGAWPGRDHRHQHHAGARRPGQPPWDASGRPVRPTAVRPFDRGAGAALPPERRQGAADRRRRRCHGRAGLCQDPGRRQRGAALHRHGL